MTNLSLELRRHLESVGTEPSAIDNFCKQIEDNLQKYDGSLGYRNGLGSAKYGVNKYGEVKWCQTCEAYRQTSCNACGCGGCTVCDFRFCCNPINFNSQLQEFPISVDLVRTPIFELGRNSKNDEITVTHKNFYGTLEICEPFFDCPKCEKIVLLKNCNYCPNCGSKLKWEVDETKYYE